MTEQTNVALPRQPTSVLKLALIGGFTITFLGALFYIAQRFDNWADLAEMLVSLGLGTLMLFLGMRGEQQKPGNRNTTIFLTIGLPFLFSGIGLLAKTIWGHHGPVGTMIVNLLFVLIALTLYTLQRRNVAMFFVLITGSIAYFRVLEVLMGASSYTEILGSDWNHSELYRTIVLGVLWSALAYVFTGTKRNPLVNFMYWVAGALVFPAMLWLAGLNGHPGNVWEIAGVVLSAALFFGSPYLNRSVIMWVGGLALLMNIVEITYMHFAKDMEWPLILMLIGLIITMMSLLAFWMRKKYLAKK